MLLRLHTFFYDYGAVPGTSVFYDLFDLSFAENNIDYKFGSIILIMFQLVYINRLSSFNNLSYYSSLFPGVFYVLLLSLIPDIHPMSTVLVGNTFVMVAVFNLFQSIHRNQRSKRLFNTGFFVSMAVFTDINFIYLVPFFIIAANTIILVRLRDTVLYFMGFLIPVYFLCAYWILTDHFVEGVRDLGNQFQIMDYKFVFQSYGIIKTGLIAALVLFVFAVVNSVITRTNIFVRNKLTFIFYLLVFSVVIFVFTFHTRLEDLQLVIMPLGILIGLYLINIKKTNIAESFHLLVLILAVLFQYFLK